MVNKTTSFKKRGKSKGKFNKGGKKAATPPMKPKNGPKPDAECYSCKEKGHWKRNCSKSGSEERPCQEEERSFREAPPEFSTGHHAVVLSDSRRSYYFRCPLEREVDVIFINNRTCDRVRRCCPFVAPEPIVIKIFYALLQAASERLLQQQEPPLVGFGISSRDFMMFGRRGFGVERAIVLLFGGITIFGRKKPKTVTKLMEIANSWDDGENRVRKPQPGSDDEEDDQKHGNDSGHRRDHRKERRDRGYETFGDTNIVVAGYTDRHDDRYDDR
ncbi:hypothetical protein QYE76_027717 [Lolium multiflorum]|uniref:CCHC-type domain-containing protein n=1 Tax=Lolium multiflorum TaxID=4521 RepID=A0AAD8QL92_LOLMU|nr:hypothetical protein QYE76_027717 [Lolium multiflorum]